MSAKAQVQHLQAQDLKVQDLGEQALLQRLYQFCQPDLVGDDAALLTVTPDRSLVVTTDMLVDRVHFSDQTTSAQDVGWRAAAANLSDLAAMGATPMGITIGLGLPAELAVSWVEGLYQGMVDCLQQYGTPIVGGDICRSSVTTVSITAFGQVQPEQAIRRNQAKPGDVIVVTGVHGASRAGLELLLHPDQGQTLAEADRQFLIQTHQRPRPRLDVISVLHPLLTAPIPPVAQNSTSNLQVPPHPESQIAVDSHALPFDASPVRATQSKIQNPKSKIPIAGMDSSDGLADAVLQICRASGVGAKLERQQIPFPPVLTQWVSHDQAIEWALYGGEDFELVLCLPPALAPAVIQKIPGANIVGSITAELGVVVTDNLGMEPDRVLSLEQGFQHFQA